MFIIITFTPFYHCCYFLDELITTFLAKIFLISNDKEKPDKGKKKNEADDAIDRNLRLYMINRFTQTSSTKKYLAIIQT